MSQEPYTTLVFFVNGKKVQDNNVEPEWSLLFYLRSKLKLCGTKLGCGEGGCGACTVMLSRYDRRNDLIKHIAVNACLIPVCSLHGVAITTIEGIGSTKTKLHPVQERLAKAHGSQCGFCTPGIIMSMYTLLRTKPKPSMNDFDVTFQGNLCRCTGYRAIIEGYRTFTEEWEETQRLTNGMNGCAMGVQCCQNQTKDSTHLTNGFGSPNSESNHAGTLTNGNDCALGAKCCKYIKQRDENEILFDQNEFKPYDPSQEPIFPPELKLNPEYDAHNLYLKGKSIEWFRPNTFEELLDIKEQYPNAKFVVGNSEIGVEMKFRRLIYPIIVQPTNVLEMTGILETDFGMRIGASVTLMNMEEALKVQIKARDESRTRIFSAIVNMLYYFAGKQIRNVASIGGNLMTSSPISDLNPILTAANCVLEVCSKQNGMRKLVMNEHFFTGYRRNLVAPDELLVAVNIPWTTSDQYCYAYKQAKRRDDDIAIVNEAINVCFEPGTKTISQINIAFGGMAITTVMAVSAQKALVGKEWNDEMLEVAYEHMVKDLPLEASAPGGNIHYRRSLTLSLFFRAYLAISQQLQLRGYDVNIPKNYYSGISGFHHKIPKSSQYFQVVPDSQKKTDYVGRTITHAAAFKQSTGEAVYCDDIPSLDGELYMSLVVSTEAHAEIVSIDATEALKTEGVHAFFSAKDIDHHNNEVGPVRHDEEVFASKKVTSKGIVIGVIIADNQYIGQMAVKKVKIEYKKLTPIIVTIEDAIKHNSFFEENPTKIVNGNVEEAFANSDYIIEGECRTGGQEHFYLETQCVIAIPKEGDEIELICSTQHPSEVTKLVAHVLGVPMNQVVTKAKRLGGGFGGKESRGILTALPAAFAAKKLNRPIRCMLDRDEDMMVSGTRHPFLLKYKTSFNADGKITGCKIHIYNNAGYSADLSFAVVERAMFHFENAYYIPNVEVYGYVCKTNIPSNTAFRGFGGPQGMFAGENMIRDVAEFLGKDIVQVQQLNLYKEGNITHYNQLLTYCTLSRCWNECMEMADYHRRKEFVDKFNRENRWKKRGIAVVPTTFGIAFTILFLNQAGALIIVYTDGSVLLTHGGIEMGQGLHTKMIQIASRVLGIPVNKIHISETATDKVPNTSPTAASAGSDLNGMAVKEACEKIMARLEPVIKKNPKGTWEQWIQTAYFERISLSATGYHKTPDIGYSFETNTGTAFNYFTFATAITEVEVDCLTGDNQIIRADIVMDLGESLNPAIDIGQIEGGFVQGYGLFTLEEMMYSPNGDVLTKGPGAYKLPGFGDIPAEFNVALLKGAPNPRAVFSSKAVGEPPLFLASSALFAIREAIKSARNDAGLKGHFRLNAPATSAKIRILCDDHLTSKFVMPEPGTFTPWNVIP